MSGLTCAEKYLRAKTEIQLFSYFKVLAGLPDDPGILRFNNDGVS